MNDLQIEYFLAVADALNFTKAASGKYVSQPAISRQIRLMEEELGVLLFKRGSGSTKLTEAGVLYADFFRRQRTQLEELSKTTKGLLEKESLSLAYGSFWGETYFLPEIFREMRTDDPELLLSIRCHDFHRLESLLYNDAVDVIITLKPDIHASVMIESRSLTDIENGLIVSARHPLAARKNLCPQDFKDETFLIPLPYESDHIASLIAGFVEPYGFAPTFRNAVNIESFCVSIAHGLGVGVIDEWAIHYFRDAIRFIPIEAKHTAVVEWKKHNQNPALTQFLAALFKRFDT